MKAKSAPFPLGTSGVLRPGRLLWLRSLCWIAVMLLVLIAILSLQSLVRAVVPDPTVVLVMAFVCTVLAYSGYAALVRWGERRIPSELDLRRLPGELSLGILVGALLFTMVFAILWLTGSYDVARGDWYDWQHDIREAVGTGLLEELISRAVIFRLLTRAFGMSWAFAISATVFGAAHLGNAHATPFAALAIAVEAGLMLAAFYALTGRIWMSVGAHAAWNFMQGAVFGARVSGMPASGSLLTSHPASGVPALLSGGEFGPEASVPAILVGGVAFLLMYRHISKRRELSPDTTNPS